MKDVCISLPSGGGKITDIESTGDSFIRFKNGYQICWGLELWDQMDHPGTGGSTGGGDGNLDSGIMGNGGGHKSGDGTQSTSSYGDNSNTVCGGTKAITFPVPFNIIPYIAISQLLQIHIKLQIMKHRTHQLHGIIMNQRPVLLQNYLLLL